MPIWSNSKMINYLSLCINDWIYPLFEVTFTAPDRQVPIYVWRLLMRKYSKGWEWNRKKMWKRGKLREGEKWAFLLIWTHNQVIAETTRLVWSWWVWSAAYSYHSWAQSNKIYYYADLVYTIFPVWLFLVYGKLCK